MVVLDPDSQKNVGRLRDLEVGDGTSAQAVTDEVVRSSARTAKSNATRATRAKDFTAQSESGAARVDQ